MLNSRNIKKSLNDVFGIAGRMPVLDQTTFWQYGVVLNSCGITNNKSLYSRKGTEKIIKIIKYDCGKPFFYANPPVNSATPSERILVAGCSSITDTIRIEDFLDNLNKTSKENFYLTKCRSIGAFWASFFGTEDFIGDSKRTIPKKIITNGHMRNYSRQGGETIGVEDRLKEIGENWMIEVEVI